jgi:hypothetical protein
MSTSYKPYTIGELVDLIYDENQNHFQKDCDCRLCITLSTIMEYWGE